MDGKDCFGLQEGYWKMKKTMSKDRLAAFTDAILSNIV